MRCENRGRCQAADSGLRCLGFSGRFSSRVCIVGCPSPRARAASFRKKAHYFFLGPRTMWRQSSSRKSRRGSHAPAYRLTGSAGGENVMSRDGEVNGSMFPRDCGTAGDAAGMGRAELACRPGKADPAPRPPQLSRLRLGRPAHMCPCHQQRAENGIISPAQQEHRAHAVVDTTPVLSG